MLRLEVLDFEGPTAWRWRLTEDPGGAFVADEQVRLDAGAWQFEAFADLDDYLRWHAAPDRRAESEAELVAAVGAWVGEQVFGRVGRAMVEREPVTVRVGVPAAAEMLAYRPLELGWVGGAPVGVQGVSLVIELAGAAERATSPVGERLRMLGVFSLPVGTSALNLRRERVGLGRLVREIATVNGRAVELRVLQYGVTRERLEEVMLEDEGWDVLHISGHGLPAGLLLEKSDGQHDLVSSSELAGLLEPAAEQLKLVLMSSCESAALTAAEHLRLLGIDPPKALADELDLGRAEAQGHGDAKAADGNGAVVLPALAAALAGRLDCAVVAMRYPVADEFAIALAERLYDLVLGKGRPLPRALALALPKVVADPPTADSPAISVATPALFGARAAELRLDVPIGAPVVYEQQKLAKFPPQPERFVGRVGAMTRATAVLAPRSLRAGVLFHGMAGAGKTACALELAYTHEQSFGRLVWHKAPDEAEELAPALTGLALDLEAQLPGVRMVHLVDDVSELRGFLADLTSFLRQQRVLIVLDNCESLLTDAGDWRDERWKLVVDALTGHNGLSRLVMTSRRRPRQVPAGMEVEPVHALSATEAVLLAREWPHLRALLDRTISGLSPDEARGLAAHTLAMVQGHPKLIELADGQATDPDALRARLTDANHAWLHAGIKPDEFLEQGEPTASDADYLNVLDRWTRGTTATLPDASRLLFSVLCCLEPEDRGEPAVTSNWGDVWRRLERPGEPTTVEAALGPLSEHALVAVERDAVGQARGYHVHPAVAATGRADAGSDLQAAVEQELADYWVAVLHEALEREGEQLGWLVLRAARGALPYLLRRHEWSAFTTIPGEVLRRDKSARTGAGLLPLLRQAATAAKGTEHELRILRQSAWALEYLRPAEAAIQYRELLERADTQQDYEAAGILASDLSNLLMRAGRPDEALTLTERAQDYYARAGLGPWTQLSSEARRLQALGIMGRSEQVLDDANALRARMADLAETSEQPETANPFYVREAILDTAAQAASALDRWEDALRLNAERLDWTRRRDAGSLELALAEFNQYGPLLRLGRVVEARNLLLRCRHAFEQEHYIEGLGATLSALAEVEDGLGHGDRALRLETDALRLKYTDGAPAPIRVSHFNVSNYLRRYGGDRREALAHRLASAIVAYQTSSGRRLDATLRKLASEASDAASIPVTSWDELCELIGRTEGVNLADLVAELPTPAADGPAALAEVLRLSRELPPEQVHDFDRHFADWDLVISALLSARGGDQHAADLLDQTLNARGQHPDWTALSGVLRRLAADEDAADVFDGLDPIDSAIVQRALDALNGQTDIAPDAWHALAALPDDSEPLLEDQLAGLIAAVAAAVRGDQQARETLQPVLNDMAQSEAWGALAGVLRRILAGERVPALLDGLDATDTAVVTSILDDLADESTADPDLGQEP